MDDSHSPTGDLHRILYYTDDLVRAERTVAQLQEVSSRQLEYHIAVVPAELEAALGSPAYDIFAFDCAPAFILMHRLIELACRAHPTRPMVVIVDSASMDEVVDLMRMGACAVVHRNDLQRLYDLIQLELTVSRGTRTTAGARHSRVATDLAPETERRLLENILETMQDAIMSLSQPDRRLIFASASFEQLFGYPVERFLDDPHFFQSVVHPDDLGLALEAMQKAVRDGFVEVSHRIILPDGSVRWLHRRATVLFDEDHQILQVTDSARDITAQREAEDALRASEELHRMVLHNISDAVFITDSAGDLAYVCPNVQRIFGYTQEEITALRNISSVLGHIPVDAELLDRVGEVSNIEHPIVDSLGQKHDLLVNVKRVQIGRGTTLFTCRDTTERKAIERQLSESTDWMRLALDASNLGKWRHDLDIDRIDFDERARQCYGFDTYTSNFAEVLARLHPDDVARLHDVVAAALDPVSGGRYGTEYRVIHPDGSLHWLYVNVLVYFEDEGAAHRARVGFGTCQDITARKALEEAIRDSEAHYRSIVEDQTDLICRYDLNLQLTFGNRAYCDLVGLTPSTLAGHSILDWIPLEEHPASVAHVHSLTRENPTAVSVHRSVLPDGSVHWVEWVDRAFLDEQGLVTGYQGVGRDITEQKLAQDMLRASEEKYRSLIDSSDAAISMVDADGRYLFLNSIAAAPFAQPPHVLQGRLVHDLFPVHQADQIMRDVRAVITSNTGMKLETNVTLAEMLKWFKTSIQPVRDAAGTPYAALIYATDITEHKLAEAALHQSEERLRLFIRYAPAAIAMLDTNMIYLAVSNRWLSDYHLDDQNIIGRSHYEVFPDIPEVWKDIHRRCLNGAVEKSDADPFPRSDGSLEWVRWEIRPWRDYTGVIGGILLFSEVITAQKQAEQALQEVNTLLEQRVLDRTAELERTKNRIEAIFNHSGDGILLLSVAHGIQQANRAFEEMFGVTEDSYLGRKLGDLFQLEASNRIEDSIHTVATTHGLQHVAARRVRADGMYMDVEISVAPINRSAQAVTNIVCIIRDITARKQAEDLLRESEARYRLLAENVKDVIGKMSPDGIRTFITPSVYELLGYEPDELIGQRVFDAVHPDDVPLFQRAMQQTVQQGRNYFVATQRLRHKNGSYVWVEVVVTLVRDAESGQLAEITAVIRDITERKQAEAAIAEERNLLRTVIDSLLDQIYVKDTNGRILLSNAAYARALGYDGPESVSGKTDADLLPAEVVAKHTEVEQQVVASGQPYTSSEERAVSLSGAVAWLMTTRVPLRNLRGDIIGLVGISHDITQIKEGEQALRVSEERYRTTVAALSEGILVYDSSGRMQLCNTAAEQILGLSRDEIMRGVPTNARWRAILTDGSPFPMDRFPGRLTLRTGKAQSNVIMGIQKPDNELTWVLINTQLVVDPESAQVNAVVVSCIDITQSKKAEDALRESEARYRLIAENVSDVIAKISPDGIRTFATPSTYNLVGYRPEELINRPIWEMLHPDDVPAVKAQFRQALESGSPFLKLTQKIRHKDGHFVWVEMTNTLVRDVHSGQPLEFIAIIHDVTARKQAEDELRALSQRLQLATEVGGIGIWDWDIITDTLIWDDQMFALYGLQRGDVPTNIDAAWDAGLLHRDDDTRMRREVEDALAARKSLDTEFRVIRPDGSVHYIKVRAVVFRDTAGTPVRMLGVNWEITLLKQAEENLRLALEKEKELGELKSRFVSMASHEFRTPLAAIMATTETLSIYRDRMDQAQIDARLNKIRQQVLHMKDIMEDVLQLARIQARRVEFKPSLSDLNALCCEIVEEFESQAEYRGRIVYHNDSVEAEIVFDIRLLRQVISNLLSNALKYSPAESPVYLSLNRGDDHLVLTVRDLGIGIPAADLRHMFEPFHRASNVGTIAGTGLGLSIARQSVEMHRGSIRVESQENAGTTVTVMLPVA